MTTRTIIECDRCGAQESVQAVHFVVDRVPDSAGGSEDVVKSVDLCPKHLLIAFNYTLRMMTHEEHQTLYEICKRDAAR